jgi:LmbE family N-acetylglucosaminyl deacetylase
MKLVNYEGLVPLAVFAHPDDETFRPGGTLALLARKGAKVHLLTATRGEAGSRGDPPLCEVKDLADVRERELRCACAALGLEPPRVLNYKDGHLHEADPEAVVADILAFMDEVRPQVVLTFGADGLSGHPDHVSIGQCTAQAYAASDQIAALYTLAVPRSLAEQLEMRQVHSVPDEQIALRVDVTPAWEIKKAAMNCHMTQRTSTPLMSAPEERQRLFFGREFFVQAACRAPESDFMPDLLKEYSL